MRDLAESAQSSEQTARDLSRRGSLKADRDYLVRFARGRLRDSALAEDMVHEVFEAILAGRARFSGKSSLRTWMVGVLKHKMADEFRTRERVDQYAQRCMQEAVDALCTETSTPGPEVLIEQRESLALVLQAVDELPYGLRRVIQFRTLQDKSTELVCEELSISEGALNVRLHRARERLSCVRGSP